MSSVVEGVERWSVVEMFPSFFLKLHVGTDLLEFSSDTSGNSQHGDHKAENSLKYNLKNVMFLLHYMVKKFPTQTENLYKFIFNGLESK